MYKVADNTDGLPAVTMTMLSVILLVTALIMGLKIRWFRARMNMQRTKSSSELTSMVGVYRSQPFEVASAAPPVRKAPASTSSYKAQTPTPSQVPPPSSSAHMFKSDSQKKHLASSLESPLVEQSQPSKQDQKYLEGKKTETKSNPHSTKRNPPAFATMGQTRPSDRKEDNTDRNRSKEKSATSKNPLAKHNELSKANTPLQSMQQNMKPKSKVPGHKGTIQKTQLPPPTATQDDNSSSLEFTDNSSTYLKLPDDNHTPFKLINDSHTSYRETDDSFPSLKPTPGGLNAFKLKTPVSLYVTEQDDSESES